MRGDQVGVEGSMTDLIDRRDIQFFLETLSDFLRPGFGGWEEPTPIVRDQNGLQVQDPTSPVEPETAIPVQEHLEPQREADEEEPDTAAPTMAK